MSGRLWEKEGSRDARCRHRSGCDREGAVAGLMMEGAAMVVASVARAMLLAQPRDIGSVCRWTCRRDKVV